MTLIAPKLLTGTLEVGRRRRMASGAEGRNT